MFGKILRHLLLLSLFFIFGAGALGYLQYQKTLMTPLTFSSTTPSILHIGKGSNINQIATILRDNYGMNNRWTLIAYARFHQQATQIKAGDYQLHEGMTPLDLLNDLVAGKIVILQFQIIEGHTTAELLQALAKNPNIKHTLQNKTEADIAKLLGINTPLEGQFLPETYHFQIGDSDLDLLKRMHQALNKALNNAWQARNDNNHLKTPYDALILASIIEKETGIASERKQISGVFQRRLEQNMRLQTDPSVIYGMGESYTGNITRQALNTDTPYNTYTRYGLPPTPITLPSKAAIEAATQPDDSNSLYFVANGKGGHTFSDTYSQHQKAVQVYRQQQESHER